MAQAAHKRPHAKFKLCRQLGENLWAHPKCPTIRRATAPGQHGDRRRKLTDYGIQLREKQKLKGYYGNITEKQFRTIFKEAERRKGDTSENLIGLLESRLDAAVYRLNFVPSVFSARQLVNHKHVLVNGRIVNIPSYRLKKGDIIELREKAKAMVLCQESIQKMDRAVPDYFSFDPKKAAGEFKHIPVLDEVPYAVQMNPNMVVEFYSR